MQKENCQKKKIDPIYQTTKPKYGFALSIAKLERVGS